MARRVLVFPAGTEIGLEILNALRSCRDVEVLAAGQDISNHARLAYDRYHVLPSVHEPGWVEATATLCRQLGIDYIFPAYDDVLVALVREAARIPARVISSSRATVELTRSKSATYRAFASKLRVPTLYHSPTAVDRFPVIVKPDRGQGSQGVSRVQNWSELSAAQAAVVEPLVCEYLPGEEYTVDCLSDRERGLLFCGARLRRRIRNGISVNTVTMEVPEALAMAQVISRELEMWGAWFFQARRSTEGELALLEIAPRVGGSMAAHRVAGVNFPWLSILEAERVPFEVRTNPGVVELDRALSNRYRHEFVFDTLFIDLDDTLVTPRGVNLNAVKLVYRCINARKKVVLLTRHRGNLMETLARHRLLGLFDAVVHLDEAAKKSDYIRSTSAIFVDDSFAERMEVARTHGIPTFDGSMIELLSDAAED